MLKLYFLTDASFISVINMKKTWPANTLKKLIQNKKI